MTAAPAGRSTSDLVAAVSALRVELGVLNDRVAQAAGLNPRDLDTLDVINLDGPCSPSHLANRTGQRRATLTGVLARLEADGWVTREADPRDARSVRIAATARFGELRALYAPADAGAAAFAAGLTDAAAAELVAQLRRLADLARTAGEAVAAGDASA